MSYVAPLCAHHVSFRGVIGPSRLFSPGQLYNPMLYCMIAGMVLPVIAWFLSKRYPRSWFVYINLPVAFVGAMYMPPATGINYSAPLIIGFIFRAYQSPASGWGARPD